MENQRFRAAFDFLALRGRTGEADPELVRWWKELLELPPAKRAESLGVKDDGRRRRRRSKQSA
jgi:poly(A) polymerase